jgi:hypothetical protein
VWGYKRTLAFEASALCVKRKLLIDCRPMNKFTQKPSGQYPDEPITDTDGSKEVSVRTHQTIGHNFHNPVTHTLANA